ncbi:MAG: glycerol-3-phosphate 1-O-acyltransferase PlsY [Oscillospiraceae bacterium]|nr:glycerol-3-phosphate 1-O-acyltransferase PlsY [Oscillospiraceae bacterium]MCI1990807.1 glycerol-3-phosphate 1-O-acyltransferase PlsY [Oscillospiraceae bacterium]MCI2035338.1 glycerol-3-phosphate 1-O-acyltransferase PlsY [Oscillospiraceae bacterium]
MAGILEIFAFPALVVAILAYLLGSVCFAIPFTRLFDHHADIRELGSGNAGLTNVLRSVGVKAAVFTLIFDFGKCAASVLVGRMIFRSVCLANGLPPYYAQYGAFLAGLACVLGHIYPLYFGFHGGKGILSTSAMMLFLDWRVFLVGISVFAVILAVSKIVSISSILAATSFPVSNFIFSFWDYRSGFSGYGPLSLTYVWVTTAISLLFAVILILEHHENIKRLKNGTEKKFSVKRK